MGTSNTLADAYQADRITHGPPCGVAVTRQTIAAEDVETLDRLMSDHLVSHAKISRALRHIGHHLSQASIGRHRRGDCGCGR